jgi:hypothetical protein
MNATIKILDWRALRKGALLGFTKVEFPSGLIIRCDDPRRRARHWASPPSKPMIGRDGAVMKDDRGKIRYSPIIEFRDRDLRDKWSSAVVDAARLAHPEALEA